MNKAEKDAAYKFKQDWIEAVMADTRASHATRIYAFGIYRHMYGVKDESFPGAKSIHEATGLNDGKYYKYNDWLEQAGYLAIERNAGTSNTYRLCLPTPAGGSHLPPVEVGVPPVGVTPTPSGGTNTTRKPSINTPTENNKDAPTVADAPTVTFNKIDLENGFSYRLKCVSSLNQESAESEYLVDRNGVTKQSHLPPVEVGQKEAGSRAPVERDPSKAAQAWVDEVWD